MQLRLKHILYGLFMLALWAPFLQSEFQLIDEVKLGGDVRNTATNPTLNRNAWFSGQYQSEKTDYIQQSLGFRNSLIKLNNQIAYSVFNYAKANGVIVGKSNYLMEEGYIHSYLGTDLIGDSALRSQVFKAKRIQDTLKKLNIEFLVALTLGKGAFYPEYIPDRYLKSKKDTNNYDVLSRELKSKGVNLLDLYDLLLKMKDTSKYPLFPKNGTHWSQYAELLVSDTLAKFIGNLRGKPLPNLRLGKIRTSKTMWGTDDDIEKGMNLIFDIPDLEMAYAEYEVIEGENTEKPKVLSIGDSFFWGFYYYDFTRLLFDDSPFWYYNRQVYKPEEEVKLVDDLNLKEEVESKDVVLIMLTDSHFDKLGFGFVDKLYEVYFEPEIYQKKLAIKVVKEQILNNQEWYESLKKVASEEGRPLEDVIEENAIYMVNVNSEKKK
tara:strand:+ start:6058 stop:7362 length:1305 start_codon:yes stop_codon:yes gene_type:complete